MLAHSNPEMTGAVADEARKVALRVPSTDAPLANRHRISNRHPCRLETTLNPSASTTAPLLIVTKSGVILAWICARADGSLRPHRYRIATFAATPSAMPPRMSHAEFSLKRSRIANAATVPRVVRRPFLRSHDEINLGSRYTGSAMATIYAGTSGWAYPAWKPDFYPAKLASAKFLGYYSSRLNSVEVNYTFRRFPTEKLLRGWVAATPPEFKFTVKAHQMITHVKRLHEAGEFAKDFILALQPLMEERKLGPVLFQLPPYLKCDLDRLKNFLGELPKTLRVAFEFRHESWFTGEVFALLRSANAALCEAESEKLETPSVQTADFSYLRLRKEEYSAAERKELSRMVTERARQGDIFVYFKHEDTPEGALYAESLLAR
jgi:uncharacterized protein YecE (DUF72 family)